MRHDRCRGRRQIVRAPGHTLLLLLAGLPEQIPRRRGPVSASDRIVCGRCRCRQRARRCGRFLYLPDAPGSSCSPGRALARSAAWRWNRRRSDAAQEEQSRTARHDPPLLGRPCVDAAGAALAMAEHGARRCMCNAALSAAGSPWLQLLLATPVVLWGGWPFFAARLAFGQSIGTLNMFTPDRAGHRRGLSSTAWSRRCCAGACSRRRFATCTAQPPVYFEAAAVIVDAGAAGPGAGTARPQRAPAAPSGRCSAWRRRRASHRARDGSEQDVPLEQVQVGDRLRVRPGEKMPVDGVVLEGRSARG